MDFNEVLERFQTADPNTLLEALEEVEQASIDAGKEAIEASDDYYANAAEKEEKMRTRIVALTKKRDACPAKIEAHKQALRAATVESDRKRMDSAKASMKTLESEMQELSAEIEVLEGSYISGDTELYNDVQAKRDYHLDLARVYWQAKRELYEFASEREECYKKIQKETRDHQYGGGYGPDMDKLYKHYHAEFLAKEAAKQVKEAAASRAAEANKSRDLRTAVYRFGEFPNDKS